MKKIHFLIGIALLTIMLYIAKTFEPLFIWRIPFGKIVLPIGYWVIFLGYSFWFFKSNKVWLKGGFTLILTSGLSFDLIRAFLVSEAYRISSGHYFEANIYRLYYIVVYHAGLLLICAAYAYIFRKAIIEKDDKGAHYAKYIFAPFSAVFFTSLTYLGRVDGRLAAYPILATSIFIMIIPFLGGVIAFVKKYLAIFLTWLYSHEKASLAAFFILALLIRLLYLLRTMTDPNYVATGEDGVLYDSYAWKIANNEPVDQAYASGCWIFVGLLYKIFGHNYFIACFVQGILGAITCLFIYAIIKEISNSRFTAYIGLFLATVNYSLIFNSISIGHQALNSFLSPLVAIGLIYFMKDENSESGRKIWLLITIAFASAYSMVAQESNLFSIAAVPFFIVLPRIFRKETKKGVVEIAIFSIVFLMTLAPFIARNIRDIGVPYPMTSAHSRNVPVDYFFSSPPENKKMIELGINPLRDSKKSLEIILQKPLVSFGAIAESVFVKFEKLFLDQEYGRFDMIFLTRGSPYYNTAWLYAFLITIFGIFYMLVYTRRLSRLGAYIVLSFIFLKTFPHLLIAARFTNRGPIDVFLIVAFSIGASRVFSVIRDQS